MDVKMHVGDGYEFIPISRVFSSNLSIALTDYALQGDEQKAMRNGFDVYMSNSVNTPRLYEKSKLI